MKARKEIYLLWDNIEYVYVYYSYFLFIIHSSSSSSSPYNLWNSSSNFSCICCSSILSRYFFESFLGNLIYRFFLIIISISEMSPFGFRSCISSPSSNGSSDSSLFISSSKAFLTSCWCTYLQTCPFFSHGHVKPWPKYLQITNYFLIFISSL